MNNQYQAKTKKKSKLPVIIAGAAAALIAAATAVFFIPVKGETADGLEYKLYFTVDSRLIRYADVIGYNGNDESVEIPNEIKGCQVHAIREGAFENNDTVKEVKIEATYHLEVEEEAFKNCDALEYVKIVNFEELREGAFTDCENLRQVDIGGVSLGEVDDDLFVGCDNLRVVWDDMYEDDLEQNLNLPERTRVFVEGEQIDGSLLENVEALPDGTILGYLEDGRVVTLV